MADFSLGDVPIIREMIGQTKEMLSIEHVTVVGNLHWEKMQSLLQALCTQMQAQAEELNNQAMRLGKVEDQETRIADQEQRIADQDKRIVDLEAELANCKDAMKRYEEQRAKDAERQNQMMDALKLLEDQENRTRSLEAQLLSIKDELAANNLAMRDLNARVSLIEQELVPLKPLPQRMDALESTMKKLNAAVANLQQSFRAVDFGRLARMSSTVGKQPSQEAMPEPPLEPEPVMELVPVIQPDFSQVEELAANLELLNSKVSKQGEHLNDLEAQVEQQNLLIQQLMKSHDADLEALRNPLKALRQELDSKPLVPLASPEAPPDTSGLETIIVELQKRLSRKADEDAVNHVASDVQRLKDALDQMEAAMNILKRRSSALATGGPLIDSTQARLTKAEEDLVTMESNKADRSLLDALELKLSLLGTGGTGEAAVVDTSALERLTELLTKKADRSELLELRKMIQAQTARTSDDDIRRLFEGLELLRGTKADRSELSALMLRTPVPDSMDEIRSIRSILSDHALKFTKLDELLSQLPKQLDKKADQASFLFLQDLMESLKQNRKSRPQSFSSSRALQQFTDEASMLHQMLSELTTTLNEHERVLQQLTEGVLIMSGHNAEEEIATGIVSTFQPDLDDGISEASESRPSTARIKAAAVINRVEHSPPHTSNVNVANNQHESPRQRMGPVVESVSTPTQEMLSREAVQPAHIVESKFTTTGSQQEQTPLYATATSPTTPATNAPVTYAPSSPSPGPPQVSQALSYEPSRVVETQQVVRESMGLSQQSPLVESVPAVHPVQPVPLSFTSQQFSVQRSEPREVQSAEVNPPREPVRVQVDSGIATDSRQIISPAKAVESRAVAESTQDATSARFVESREAIPFVEGVVDARQVAVAESRSNPPSARGPEVSAESRGPSRGLETAQAPELVQSAPYPRAPEIVESRQNARAPEVMQNAPPGRVPEVFESRQNGRGIDTSSNSSRQNGRAPDATAQNSNRQNGRAPDTTQNSSRQNVRAPDTTQNSSRQNGRTPDAAQGRSPDTALDFSYSLAPDTVQAPVYARTPEVVQPRAPEIVQTFSSNRDADAGMARQIDSFQPLLGYEQNISPVEGSATGMSSVISPWSNTFTIATSPEVRSLDSTYAALEAALKEKKIRAKENVRSKDLEVLRIGIEELRRLLSSMEVVKADKHALEELWQFVRANITENAMFTGKPLLGFKCMSCEHSLEKLNPFRSDYLPTNMMPKQWLSMFTADRLFNNEKREEKPGQQVRSPSPPRSIAPSPFPKTSPTGNQEQQQQQQTGGTTPPGNQAGSGALVRPDANQNNVAKANVQLGPRVASISIRK